MKKTIGIYIHIPFCVQKCLYCDFASFPLRKSEEKKVYIQALLREMEQYKDLLKDYKADTVYIGGGTPSILSGEEVAQILNRLGDVVDICRDAEISMEMNPGTAKREWISDYKKAGVNRVSVGLQSADAQELKMLGRIHNYQQFLETFRLLRECGFENINVDLMSGLPHQKMETYADTLEKVVALCPEHISAYSLIVEEGTPFFQYYGSEKGREELLDEELDRQMYFFTRDFLNEKGYHHYEISNYARKGYECRHNLKYWQLGEYLGLGLAAASLVGKNRLLNVGTLEEYCDDLIRKEQRQRIFVSPKDEMEEFMFLGLRTMEGVSKQAFLQRFGVTMEEVYALVVEKYEKLHMLENGTYLRLSDQGVYVSNVIMADFL